MASPSSSSTQTAPPLELSPQPVLLEAETVPITITFALFVNYLVRVIYLSDLPPSDKLFQFLKSNSDPRLIDLVQTHYSNTVEKLCTLVKNNPFYFITRSQRSSLEEFTNYSLLEKMGSEYELLFEFYTLIELLKIGEEQLDQLYFTFISDHETAPLDGAVKSSISTLLNEFLTRPDKRGLFMYRYANPEPASSSLEPVSLTDRPVTRGEQIAVELELLKTGL